MTQAAFYVSAMFARSGTYDGQHHGVATLVLFLVVECLLYSAAEEMKSRDK